MKRCCIFLLLLRAQMGAAGLQLLLAATLWTLPPTAAAAAAAVRSSAQPPAATQPHLRTLLAAAAAAASRSRRKRGVSPRDVNALLDYHNRVRSQVSPPAADMEYMLWDEGLAESAASWASRCVWDHGPTRAMKYLGQNLSVSSGRSASVTDLLRSWSEERQQFSYPGGCSGSVCSHYTQMVWASTTRVGCAVRRCSNMRVFGSTWREATLLVCNYSIKGNWVGEAPYRRGRPCSLCPSSYAASCWRNQCTPKTKVRRLLT